MRKKLLFTLLILAICLFYYDSFVSNDIALPEGASVDSLYVLKSQRRLQAFSQGKLLKTYAVSLGANPEGDKQFEGDKRTPEGWYFINDKNPNSQFYKNLGISYPNEKDVIEATAQGKSAGKDIKIHGLGSLRASLGKLHLQMDWTAGCIAITNAEIEELYAAVSVGTPILIEK